MPIVSTLLSKGAEAQVLDSRTSTGSLGSEIKETGENRGSVDQSSGVESAFDLALWYLLAEVDLSYTV